MGLFFPAGAEANSPNTLISVVSPMSPQAKQAMYAAAEKGLIVRGTWDGCAWNQAGSQAGNEGIKSIAAAANVFGDSPSVISSFIQVWDKLKGSDEYCTTLLKEAIEKVGITDPPNRTRLTRVVRGFAFKSLDTKFKEELENVSDISDMPGMTSEMVDTVKVLLNA